MITGIIIGFLCGAFLWFPLGVWFISLFRNLEPEIHNKALQKVVRSVIRENLRSVRPEMQETEESGLGNTSPMDKVYRNY